MFRLGAHVSIAGGVSNAIIRERAIGGNCGQIFASSPRAWAVSVPPEKEISQFKKLRRDYDQFPYAIHSKYLVNLGTNNEVTFKRSVEALQRELDVASVLGVEYVVFHPGAYTGGLSRKEGMARVAEGISSLNITKGIKLLLENASGRGSTLGSTFEELRKMIYLSDKEYASLGICLDTCHAFCAGYPIHEERGLESTLNDIDNTIGLENLLLIHLNDSKHPFDSKKDEHEHIGQGYIGEGPFKLIVNNEVFLNTPLVLETPISVDKDYAWNISKINSLLDAENIDKVRAMIK